MSIEKYLRQLFDGFGNSYVYIGRKTKRVRFLRIKQNNAQRNKQVAWEDCKDVFRTLTTGLCIGGFMQ